MVQTGFLYKGAIHIHTNLSDGTGNIESISLAAKKCGLDFIIVTDHNHYDEEEGFYNGVCVIKGEEISPENSNHYLALGINKEISSDMPLSSYTEEVRQQGGFGFAAHPDEGISERGEKRKNSYHCIPYDKSVKPDGVEIWNWFSAWADNMSDKNIFTLAYAYLFKHNIVSGPNKKTLCWWDKLNNESEKVIPAAGGVDAHALKIRKYIIPVTIFPYRTSFSTITNVINLKEKLSDNFDIAKAQILDAVKNGRNIIYNKHTYKHLPDIYIKNNKKSYFCGAEIESDENCCLYFRSESVMKICLIYNGEKVQEYVSKDLIIPVQRSGKYRLEVFYKNKAFLYTNPFCVK